MYANSEALTFGFFSGLSYINIQNPIQTNPKAPMIINAISQPKALAIKGMVMGAASAPTVAPALKILVARLCLS